MSFLNRMNANENKKIILQKLKHRQNALVKSPVIPPFFKLLKRASGRALPGNMTVEAALALPLFLFAVMNLLSLLLMFRSFSAEEAKLHQTGRKLAMLAYGQEESGGSDIRLVKTTRIRAFIPAAAFPDAVMVNGCVMHKWIGYDPGENDGAWEEQKEEFVYITKSGVAYHRDRACIYLNPSIEITGIEQAKGAVNGSGEKYRACEICGGNSSVVYITAEGSRYHSTVSCSGLRRTINSVPLSEALEAGKHACPKCGGGD